MHGIFKVPAPSDSVCSVTYACGTTKRRLTPGLIGSDRSSDISARTLTGCSWRLATVASAVATGKASLHLGLLRDLERVVNLDSEISDSVLELRVPEQQLNRPEIPCPPTRDVLATELPRLRATAGTAES